MIWIILCCGAAFLLYAKGGAIFIVAVVNAVANFWSVGIIANYRDDPERAPDIAWLVRLITAVVGIGLLIYALAT